MMMAAIAAGGLSVAAWLYLLLGRGGFWRVANCSAKNNCGKAQNGKSVSVVAVIPARNERETIGRAVASLLEQVFAGTLRVIVVDDQSDDGTAEVVSKIRERMESGENVRENPRPGQNRARVGHPTVTIIRGKALPEGWSGKVWAMQQGIEAGRAFAPEFYLFTDADVVHAPGSVAKLVEIAERGAYDLTSLMVRLHCESAAERLLIPSFVFFFFMLYPPRWIADRQKKTAGAAGGCMLVRADALERVGRLEAIRGEVIDDCALARLIKAGARLRAQGARTSNVWLGLSDDTESVREYGGFGEVGRMIARTAFNQLHHSGLILAGALVGLAVTFVAPVALACVSVYPTLAKTGLGWATQGSSWATLLLGGAAWAMMTAAYLPMVRFYNLNPMWALTLAGAALFYMGATVWSAVKYWSGRGGEWKGRAQDRKRVASD